MTNPAEQPTDRGDGPGREMMREIGRRLAGCRKARRMNQKTLSVLSDVLYESISRLENGRRKPCTEGRSFCANIALDEQKQEAQSAPEAESPDFTADLREE